MKQHKTKNVRHTERGSVTVVVACLLTTLFAFSALAVDMGFRYTKSRTLQAVADSAVTAGMPSMVSGDTTTAYNKARDMAQANGYSGTSQVVIDSTSVSGQLKVTTKMTAPSFFAAIFGGGSSKAMSGTAIGIVTGTNGPALLALGNCSSSPGISMSGQGKLTIQGDIQSNAPITLSTGGGSLPQTDSGSVQSQCGLPTVFSGTISYTGAGVLPAATSPFPDPFFADTPPVLETYCTGGTSMSTTLGSSLGTWTAVAGEPGIYSLAPGVYCSSANINLSGPGTGFIANGVSLFSAGQVTIGANDVTYGSVLTAASGVPSGLAVYAGASGGGALTLGSNNLTVNGSVYVPNGIGNLNGQTGMVINGSVIAQGLQIGIGTSSADWTFNPSGASGTTNWRMYK
jgi:hypothetical protein